MIRNWGASANVELFSPLSPAECASRLQNVLFGKAVLSRDGLSESLFRCVC